MVTSASGPRDGGERGERHHDGSVMGGGRGGRRSPRDMEHKQHNSGARHDHYVSGLLHQIRLLELEVAYLKKGGKAAHKGADGVASAAEVAAAGGEGEGQVGGESRVHPRQSDPTPPSSSAPLADRLREEVAALRSELGAKAQRLESLSAENMQLQVGRGFHFRRISSIYCRFVHSKEGSINPCCSREFTRTAIAGLGKRSDC